MSKTATSKVFGGLDNSLSTEHAKLLTNGSFLKLCTFVPNNDFFSLKDNLSKLVRIFVLFYVMLLLNPWKLFLYVLQYEQLYRGYVRGTLCTVLFFPLYPGLVVLLRIGINIANALGVAEKCEPMESKGYQPKGLISSMIYDAYNELAPSVGMFLAIGYDPTGIQHIFHDTIAVKAFWRNLLRDCGADVPDEIGNWNGKEIIWKHPYVDQDVFIKLPDSFFGIGDAALKHGRDIYTIEDIKTYMEKNYWNQQDVLILEWVKPANHLEVHTFDILTIGLPNQKDVRGKPNVQVVSVLYWGSCADGYSSNSAISGYICDADEERIIGGWNGMKEDPEMLSHAPFKGLRKSIDIAIQAHMKILKTQPWLTCIGWDMEITERGPVFFEGNFAAFRLPRRIFLSWKHMFKAFQIFYLNDTIENQAN